MVKDNICPSCFGLLPKAYIEEGSLRIADGEISCPDCGWWLSGSEEDNGLAKAEPDKTSINLTE